MEVNRDDDDGAGDGQTREGYGGTLTTSYKFYYLQRERRVSLAPNLGL